MICTRFSPGLFRWARKRSEFAQEDFAGKFNTLPKWEVDEARRTLKQVEAFVRPACVCVGYNLTSTQDLRVRPVRPERKPLRWLGRWK